MRDVKDKYTATRVHLLSAFRHAKDPIDKRERSELPQKQTYQCLCAGGGAGRPKACCAVFWAEKIGSYVGAPALQASGIPSVAALF